MPDEPVAAPDLGQIASEAVSAPNPMTGVSPAMIARSAASLLGIFAGRPLLTGGETARITLDMLRAVGGRGAFDVSADRRFADSMWRRWPYSMLAQQYLVWRAGIYRFLSESLPDESGEKAQLIAGILAEALSPTNTLLGNPAALRQLVNTRGRSLLRGVQNLTYDIRNNGGMPSLAYPGTYHIGTDLAATPGSVVHRTPVYELIQYRPQTPDVHAIPIVFVASPINKYYFLDLAPGRSLIEYSLQRGLQAFAISWRNPTAGQRDWGMETYVKAVDDAETVAASIVHADSANLVGVCAGGIMTALLLAYRTATSRPLPHAATYLVSGIDASWPSAFGELAGTGAEEAIARSRRMGIMPGRDFARAFGLLRPNELIWGMFVNNYLLGNEPPGTEILAWNTDLTNVAAALHADIIGLLTENPLAEPDRTSIAGTSVDLAKVTVDSYTVGGVGDHIVPWQSCYRSARLFGGTSRFVAASGGHIQSIVNPPGHPRSRYRTGPQPLPEDPAEWMTASIEHTGTWWDDWIGWLQPQSGDLQPASENLGDDIHPPLMDAPGRYVHQAAS
jgi:polyhydroxyalkanoate synthase subunit PhaC